MENIGLYLSIYGAILSTIAIVWNIQNKSRARKGVMKIEVFRNTAIPVYNNRSVGESYETLEIRVVNLSEKSRFIREIQFELKQEKNKFMSMIDLNNLISYPVELSPGKEFKRSYRIDDINENNLNPIVAKEFRVFLKDTHGRSIYRSGMGLGC
jgi:hypothetical protein